MQRSGEPGHNLEFAFLGLVTKVALAKHCTGPAADKREYVKPFFWHPPTLRFGLSFVPAVHQKCGNAGARNQDRITKERIGGQKTDDRIQ